MQRSRRDDTLNDRAVVRITKITTLILELSQSYFKPWLWNKYQWDDYTTELNVPKPRIQIESRANVYEIRGNHLVIRQRHHRNVVSALGHFLSLVVS